MIVNFSSNRTKKRRQVLNLFKKVDIFQIYSIQTYKTRSYSQFFWSDFNNILTIIRMENKQLQRELNSIVQSLKGDEISRITECLQREHGIYLHKNFTKSGINCTCCTLSHENFTATGFGRSQQQALLNATRNYLQTLIAANACVPQLRIALKQRDSRPEKQLNGDETLVLSGEKGERVSVAKGEVLDVSAILSERGGCNCVYYEVHQHHLAQIKNMEARMKLIMRENEMLKELLLKDLHKDGKNKENFSLKANYC